MRVAGPAAAMACGCGRGHVAVMPVGGCGPCVSWYLPAAAGPRPPGHAVSAAGPAAGQWGMPSRLRVRGYRMPSGWTGAGRARVSGAGCAGDALEMPGRAGRAVCPGGSGVRGVSDVCPAARGAGCAGCVVSGSLWCVPGCVRCAETRGASGAYGAPGARTPVAKDGANMALPHRFNSWARGNNPSGPSSSQPPEPHSPHTVQTADPPRAHAAPQIRVHAARQIRAHAAPQSQVPTQSPPAPGPPEPGFGTLPPRVPEPGFICVRTSVNYRSNPGPWASATANRRHSAAPDGKVPDACHSPRLPDLPSPLRVISARNRTR